MSVAVAPPPSVLPRYLSRFIGRTAELDTLHRRLVAEPGRSSAERLIVLLGPGGIGKTRLAVEFAARLTSTPQRSPRFPDGACWIECAPISGLDDLLAAVTAAAGLAGVTGSDPVAALRHQMQRRRVLLVLDNCEHLTAEIESLSSILLSDCPGLALLVTSRAPIAVGSALEVAPLDHASPDLRGLTEASHLFYDRAGHAAPGFRDSVPDSSVVDAICRQVGGMPLAIELAAPWVRTLSASDLRRTLEQNLDLLSTTDHELPARHRMMRAVLNGTWSLMSASEQSAMRSLGIFAGGFSLEAAVRVAGASVADLSELTSRGVIRRVPQPHDDTWFVMHELLRQYVSDQLSSLSPADLSGLQQRRVEYLTEIAEEFERARSGVEENLWFDRLAREQPNVDAALSWALQHGDGDLVLRMIAAMANIWLYAGSGLPRHRSVMTSALALPWNSGSTVSAVARRRVTYMMGWATFGQGDGEVARGYFLETLELSRQPGPTRDVDLEGVCLRSLSRIAIDDQDPETATRLALQSLEICRRAGLEAAIAWTFGHLAEAAFAAGDLDQADAHLVESIAIFDRVGDLFGEAMMTSDLTDLRRRRGALEVAIEGYARVIFLARTSSATAFGRNLLRGVAAVAATLDQFQEAATLFGAADAWELVHGAWDDMISAPPDAERARVRSRLARQSWTTAYEHGLRLDPDQALTVAERVVARCRVLAVPPGGLTARELDVLALVAEGLSNDEIAARLDVSARTVHAHLRSIFRKLEVTSRTAALHKAQQLGVVAGP